jgi:hypothetical protein
MTAVSVKTVTTPNGNPSYGSAVGILTVAEMDANLNDLSTAVNTSVGKTENNTITGTNTFSGTNTFTSKPVISVSTATALEISSSNASGCVVKATASAASADSDIEAWAGTGGLARFQGYVGGAYSGELQLGSEDIKLLNKDGAYTFFYDYSAGTSLFKNESATSTFKFLNAGAANTLSLGIVSGTGTIGTTESTMSVEGDVFVELATTSGSDEVHYQVTSAGNHYTDDDAYDGIIQPAISIRSSLKTTSGGTVTMISGVTVTCSKGAAGIYNYTIAYDSADKTKRRVTTDFVVTGSVPDASGTNRTLHVDYTGSHTFTVTIHDGGIGNTNAAHRLMIHW